MPCTRRTLLKTLTASAIASQSSWLLGCTRTQLETPFQSLEQQHRGRLGIAALDTHTGKRIAYRALECFAMCSTFKVILAGAILAQSTQQKGLLDKRIHYTAQDLVPYSPITEQHLHTGMTLGELCTASLQYSDNTAANLLMHQLGGPQAVTAYARTLGDNDFQLERWETALNSAIPGDKRDTTTPQAMLHSLQQLTLGNALASQAQTQLITWMKGNTTGNKRIRKALPQSWQAGDKTGSGDYGTSNDIAILFPPERKPILLAIYFTQPTQDAPWNNDVIVEASRLVLQLLEV